MFIRVKDPSTGHEFDVPEADPRLADGRLKRVKDERYPPSTLVRHPKHCPPKLAGRTASRETGKASAKPEPQDAPAPADEATEKE
ncbi:hypothetical protein [Isoptericola sp. NPDC056605]|uniref:hypothetical protein n=1 Tax=Isoptericola sp. NPDC056605 TaxID=3345876 RepID=UPI0036B6EADD